MNERDTAIVTPAQIIQSIDGANKGVGDWVANGQPESAIGQAIQSRARSFCDSYSNAPDWATTLNAASLAGVEDQCKPYLEKNGSGGPVAVSAGYLGGQCVGRQYTVSWQIKNPDGNVIESGNNSRTGPTGPLVSGPSGFPGQPLYSMAELVGQPGEALIPFTRTFAANTFEIVSVIPSDGLPDECGNLPPKIGPNPNPRPDPTPSFDPTDTPFVDDDGYVIWPMPELEDPLGRPWRLPNIRIPNYGKENPFGGTPPGGGGGGDGGGGGPGLPGPTEPTGDGGESEGGDSTRELVGVLVDAIATPEHARKAEKVYGDVYIGAGYVFLGLPGRMELQGEGASMLFPQFFYASPPSTHWRVCANVGYNLSVTPYFREKA